jgi:hypothetical protein
VVGLRPIIGLAALACVAIGLVAADEWFIVQHVLVAAHSRPALYIVPNGDVHAK